MTKVIRAIIIEFQNFTYLGMNSEVTLGTQNVSYFDSVSLLLTGQVLIQHDFLLLSPSSVQKIRGVIMTEEV